jgi:microsomal dipeptidase-like Zn-dependent dipeptidase
MRTNRYIAHRRAATRGLAVVLSVTLAATGAIPAGLAPRTVYAQHVTLPPPPPPRAPIVGFIDTHLHQFANLAFGGFEVWGSPVDPLLDPAASDDTAAARALPDSDYIYVADDQIGAIRAALGLPVSGTPSATHDFFPQCPTSDPCYRVTIHGMNGGDDLLNFQITNANHGTTGYRPSGGGPSMDWPRWNTVTTQQAYWQWLERAYQHGLKMITMTAVNNTVLCNLGVGIAAYGCDDDSAVLRQIQGAKDLEAYIDARAGGPGLGFYRIVYSGPEARQAITDGKLAVMLGVEVDTPMGCASNVDCSAMAAAIVQHYYDLGVRVVYPVHVVDNAFGGTALYTPLFEFNNYLVNGQQFWDVTNACGVGDPMPISWRDGLRDSFTPLLKLGIVAALPGALGVIAGALALGGLGLTSAIASLAGLLAPITAAAPLLGLMLAVAGTSTAVAGLLGPLLTDAFVQFGPVGGATDPNCNNRPLTPAGTALINALIDHKMIVDVDHTDRRVFDGILDIAEARHYPGIVSGHTGLTGAALLTPTDGSVSVSHEGNKTDVMVKRIANLGGFISLIPHQSDRKHIRNISSADGIPFDCGNSSESWAQVYLYATENLQLPAVGIGSDFNGFAEWSAPRFGVPGGPEPCDGDHDTPYNPAPGVNYGPGLLDYYGNPLPQYTFGSRTWDYNVDGLAHVGLYPDFIADLQAIGLGDKLGPLFNSAEAYVRMWEKIYDTDPPTVTCGTVGSDWQASNVSVPCSAYDTGWGLQNAADASFALSTSVPAGVETAIASTGTHAPICDAGGNCTGVIPAITGIKVDKKNPTVAITTPSDNLPTYTLNQVLVATYSCSDGGSGIATCTGPIASGLALDTSVGAHAFTVHAQDNVGNSVDVAHPYNVAFGVCLLYDPTKVKTAGSTIAIKVQLCTGSGANVSDPSITLQATSIARISSTITGVPDDSGSANPDNVFRYDVSLPGYTFNLSTKGYLTGTYALSFTATGDPTTHTVQFQLR